MDYLAYLLRKYSEYSVTIIDNNKLILLQGPLPPWGTAYEQRSLSEVPVLLEKGDINITCENASDIPGYMYKSFIFLGSCWFNYKKGIRDYRPEIHQ